MSISVKVIEVPPVVPPPVSVQMEVPLDVAILFRAFLGGGSNNCLNHVLTNGSDQQYAKHLVKRPGALLTDAINETCNHLDAALRARV